VIAVLLLLACGSASDSDAAFCEDQPAVTWDNFGRGFVTENCETCHARSSTNRQFAPEDVNFDTEDDVAAHAELMLAVATGPNPAMPPEGGVSDDDRIRLAIWLRCDPP
jgi:uncharacterized membrane protein